MKRGGFSTPLFMPTARKMAETGVVSMRHSGKTMRSQEYEDLDVFIIPSEDINGSA